MESLGVLLNVLCCFVILAGPMMVLSAPSTTEIPRADAARPSVESSKSKNDPDCPWIHVARAEDAVQADKELTRDSFRSEEESAQDARRSKHTGDPRGDGFRLSYQRGSAVDLPSHDTTLPDSGAISARQAKRSTGDYRDYPASSSVTSGDDVARRSIDSSRQRGSGFKDDLGIAEYRFPPQNPYWYQRQYSNQRYRPNDRRDPYRNYLRYPVFPGR